MKATELRLGNLICFIHDVGGYIETTVDLRALKKIIQDNEFFQGIPLTKERLVRFGFKITSNEYWDFFELKSGWHISLSKHTERSAGVEIGRVYWGDDYLCVESVHQLQNLYHSLTGQELIDN